MIKIFVLASGRSGTFFLSELFRHNVNDCISKHEPSPDMFGKAIYWYQTGNVNKIKKLFKKKIKKIERYNEYKTDVYIEANHAFLKSFCDVAIDFYPDIKTVHLIRNPLYVAKSQHNRCICPGEPCKIPGYYNINNYSVKFRKKCCRWALSGEEKIFQNFTFELNRYQKLLLQWIEIENRAMIFLKKYNKYNDCYTLVMPDDFHNEKKIKDMFNFFELELKHKEIKLQGEKNVGEVPTIVTNEDLNQLQELVDHIPNPYTEIFKDEPYSKIKWMTQLIK